MENFRSWRDSWKAARRSARIDSEIKGDAKELKKTRKILLLGTYAPSLSYPTPDLGDLGLSESGKSTIVKQIRITHQGGFSQDARMKYREAVYSNLLESAQAMATALQQFRVTPADPSNVVSHSLDYCTLASFLNPFPCSKRWNSCWNMISRQSCSPPRVHFFLASRVSSSRLSTVSGKTKQSQSSQTVTDHNSA